MENRDIMLKTIIAAKRNTTSEKDKFALNFKLMAAVYNMTNTEFAKAAFNVDHVTISRLLNGEMKKDVTYQSYSDKIGAYISDNPFPVK